eukprot:763418-Hanusia_phi.AAC.6
MIASSRLSGSLPVNLRISSSYQVSPVSHPIPMATSTDNAVACSDMESDFSRVHVNMNNTGKESVPEHS